MNARKKNASSPTPAAPDVRLDTDELRRRIAEKAYNYYLARGRFPGYDLEDWLEAERLVREEMTPQARRSPGRSRTATAAQS